MKERFKSRFSEKKRHIGLLGFLTVLVISVTFLGLAIPKIMAGDTQVSDLTLQGESKEQSIALTLKDEHPEDTKIVIPLPEGITYTSNSNPNIGVTYDELNKQVVIDWVEGEEKQVELQLEAEQEGRYDFTARTVRDGEPVTSIICSVVVDIIVREQGTGAKEVLEDGEILPTEELNQDFSEEEEQNKDTKATTRTNLANFYVDLPATAAYGGVGTLKIRPFAFDNFNGEEFALYNLYIAIPKGLSVDGGENALELAYKTFLDKNPVITSAPTVKFLGKSLEGREIYKIISNGSSTSAVSGMVDIPIKVTTDESITEIYSNSGKSVGTEEYSVLYAEIDDDSGLIEIPYYPIKNSNLTVLFDVGVENTKVASIEGDQFIRTMKLFKAKTQDTYILKEKYTGEVLATKKIEGIAGDSYARTGFIDQLQYWNELDIQLYDKDTYHIQEGEELTDQPIFTPNGTLGGNPNTIYDGNTYELYVNRFAKGVTVKYEDTSGNPIGDTVVLKGHVGDKYTTEQKEFKGYTFKEVKGITTGTLTDNLQSVSYIYSEHLLHFYSVPESLSFNETKISNRKYDIQREDINWKIIVEDDRPKKSNWRVTARLSEGFKDSSGNTLPDDILLFRKENQSDQWINSETEVNVFDGESNDKETLYDISWNQNEGPLLQVAPGTVKVGKYTADITWNLIDAPV